MRTKTWDSISFSSDLNRIHNQDKGKAIEELHSNTIKIKDVALLLDIIGKIARNYEADGLNCWWFAGGRFLKPLFIASMP